MGKMKTKRKDQDFPKSKLKIGKKLPRGLNVTDTSFKSKKIVLRAQLDAQTKATPRVKIGDIVKRLGSHNPSEVLDGLKKLKDVVGIIPSDKILDVVNKLAECFISPEETIRSAACVSLRKLLHSLSGVPALQTSRDQPIVHCSSTIAQILIARLQCAIASLSANVKRDSLSFMEVLLESIPSSVVNTSSLLVGLLDLISRTREGFTTEVTTSSISKKQKKKKKMDLSPRVLTIAISSANHINWWLKVLVMLNRFLSEAFKVWYNTTESNKWSKQTIGLTFRAQLFDRDSCQRSASDVIQQLLPLLLDMWSEVHPLGDVVDCRGGWRPGVMLQIGRCLRHLGLWARYEDQTQWYATTYERRLQSFFENRFPVEGRIELNITLCHAMALCRRNGESQGGGVLYVDYLCDLLDDPETSSEVESVLGLIVEVVRCIIDHNGGYSQNDSSRLVAGITQWFVWQTQRKSVVSSILLPFVAEMAKQGVADAVIPTLLQKFLTHPDSSLSEFFCKIHCWQCKAYLTALDQTPLEQLLEHLKSKDVELRTRCVLMAASRPHLSSEDFSYLLELSVPVRLSTTVFNNKSTPHQQGGSDISTSPDVVAGSATTADDDNDDDDDAVSMEMSIAEVEMFMDKVMSRIDEKFRALKTVRQEDVTFLLQFVDFVIAWILRLSSRRYSVLEEGKIGERVEKEMKTIALLSTDDDQLPISWFSDGYHSITPLNIVDRALNMLPLGVDIYPVVDSRIAQWRNITPDVDSIYGATQLHLLLQPYMAQFNLMANEELWAHTAVSHAVTVYLVATHMEEYSLARKMLSYLSDTQHFTRDDVGARIETQVYTVMHQMQTLRHIGVSGLPTFVSEACDVIRAAISSLKLRNLIPDYAVSCGIELVQSVYEDGLETPLVADVPVS